MKITLPVQLGTARLRHLASEDFVAYMALERDADTKRFVGGPTQKGNEQARLDFQRALRDATVIAIADLQTDAYVGRCGFLSALFDGEMELYCLVAFTHQRRGIGREVFTFLADVARDAGMTPIAIVDPKNTPSRRLLESLGFHSDGPIKFVGHYQDGHLRYVPSSDPKTPNQSSQPTSLPRRR